MSNYERISGPGVERLIRELAHSRTFVKVSTADRAYEKLTVVTDVRCTEGSLFFRIDPPAGLVDALKRAEKRKLAFEFAGPDRLPHKFETVLEEDAGEYWLQCPDHIQRYQLRKNFRVKAPSNAHAVAVLEGRHVRMPVDNISLGGVLCHCPNSVKPLIFKDQVMEEVDLFLTVEGESQLVIIERAAVKRLEGRPRPRHFGLAMEFLAIKPDAQKRLTRIIYSLQRDYLKNRSRQL